MMIIAKRGIANLTYLQFTKTKGSHQAFICGVLNTLTKSILFGIAFTLITVAATAQIAKQKAIPGSKKISSELFGLFFEDINYAADGGLYAELVQNRSFEYSPTDKRDWHPFSFWQYVTPGFSYGSVSVETNFPVHPNNPHYIVMTIEHAGDTGIGIKNHGFERMVIKAGEKYNLSFFGKQLSAESIALSVSLQDPQGKVLSENKISTSSQDWKKYTATLSPSAGSDSASLVIIATTKGKLAMDVISLFPEKTFMKRSNGLRQDLAQLLADIKPKFMRFPGGCLVHGDGLGNMYRWKNTIGPVEQRIEQKNIWGYHQTAGLGYYEYFQFCEDINAKPLPVLPAAVSCQNSGGTWRIGGTGQKALPMSEMQAYIQEVLDLIEWANGPATSTWGAKRAAAGHPGSFNLQYIGIGNEDKITPEFEQRFKMIYDAVRSKYPEIILIGTSGPFSDGEDFIKGWDIAAALEVPVIDEHYYKNPEWFLGNQYRYDSYDRKKSKVYLGEYASWGNSMKNALAEAVYMTALERNGDIVHMASYAPLLAKKNFTQWQTDMIFFDNSSVFLTPNYYVQKMFSSNQGDYFLGNVISKGTKDTTFATSCVYDSETGDIILKLVNAGTHDKNVKIDLSHFKRIIPGATKVELKANAGAVNSFENPRNVAPVTSDFKAGKKFDYVVPASSLTVIRVKTK